MFYIRNKLHIPSSNSALLIETKPRAEENICKAVMLLFYILQKLHVHRIYIVIQQFRTL
jgi:hypothetical protein